MTQNWYPIGGKVSESGRRLHVFCDVPNPPIADALRLVLDFDAKHPLQPGEEKLWQYSEAPAIRIKAVCECTVKTI